MRRINKYLWLIASAAFCSCQSYDADDHKFGNVVYLDVAETTDVQTATIKNTLDELDRTFSATLAYPSGGDVTVSLQSIHRSSIPTTPVTTPRGRCSMRNTIRFPMSG